MRSPVVKLNAALTALPDASPRAGGESSPTGRWSRSRRGSTPRQEAFEACERGEPAIGFAELYFQTAYDPSSRPPAATR